MNTQNRSLEPVISNKLFGGIDKTQLGQLLDQKSFINVKEGDIIFSNGENALFVYLIADGIVKVKLSDKNLLLEKKSSDFFGEIEVIKNISRTSSAVAETDCLLYRIEKSQFIKLTKSLRGILKNISEQPVADSGNQSTTGSNLNPDETTGPEKLSYPPEPDQSDGVSFPEETPDKTTDKFSGSEELSETEKIRNTDVETPVNESIKSEEILSGDETRENEFLMPDLIKNFLKNHSSVMEYYRGYLNSGKVSGTAEHLLQLITEQSEFYSELVLSAVEYFEDKQLLKRKRYSLVSLLDELLELLSEQLVPSDITLYKKYDCEGELFADRYRLLAVLHLCSQILLSSSSDVSDIYVAVTAAEPDIKIKVFINSELPADNVNKILNSHEFLLSESIVNAHNGAFEFKQEEKTTGFVFTLPAESITTI